MLLQKKALYNLIRLNIDRIHTDDLSLDQLEPWQMEDYRRPSTDQLFQRLSKCGIPYAPHDFERYAKNFEMPEEMAETLVTEREPLEQDQIFLIIFELWRRLFPEKRSLSIFCDELDYQMSLYDLDKNLSTTELQDGLAYLQYILDEQVDQKMPPKEAFMLIQTYCATDLESFLFNYILAEIDLGNVAYSSELLEGFYRYFNQPIWFDYLTARVEIEKDPEEGYEHLEKVIRTMKKDVELTLLEEMLYFLANTGNHSLFHLLTTKHLPLLETEEDLKEFMEICYTHYEYLELKKPAEAIAELFYQRNETPLNAPLNPTDPDLLALKQILNQKLSMA